MAPNQICSLNHMPVNSICPWKKSITIIRLFPAFYQPSSEGNTNFQVELSTIVEGKVLFAVGLLAGFDWLIGVLPYCHGVSDMRSQHKKAFIVLPWTFCARKLRNLTWGKQSTLIYFNYSIMVFSQNISFTIPIPDQQRNKMHALINLLFSYSLDPLEVLKGPNIHVFIHGIFLYWRLGNVNRHVC